MRPVLFWLLITSTSVPDEVNGKDVHEEDLLNEGMVAHRFTGLSTQRQRDSLETISNWRQRFPYLQHLVTAGDLQCDIIHMDVSLNLLTSHPPEGAELCCQTVLSFSQPHEYEWRIITTLNRPPELYRDPHSDPPVESEACLGQATSLVDGETRVKIPFPAVGWANAVTCLTNLQAKYDEKRKNQALGMMSSSNARPAREYVEQISMFQEVQSSPGPRTPFTRRAIIVWTFHQAHDGEGNGTHWRYLDTSPPRRMCMSPSPQASHSIAASMSENFNNWAETPLMHQNLMDPFVQGLVTPPNTAGLASPFDANYGYGNQGFGLPGESLSFVSSNTVGEATLVDHDTAAHIDHFLSNVNAGLGDYDHNATNWALPATENFDADPAWANYSVPSTTPAIGWDGDGGKEHAWNDIPVEVAEVNGKMGWVEDDLGKQELHEWTNIVGSSPVKMGEKQELHDWGNDTQSPVKIGNYIENIEQKLEAWIEENREGEEKGGYDEVIDSKDSYEMIGALKNGYPDVGDLSCVVGNAMGDGGHEEKVPMHEWDVVDDGFDHVSLAERLKV
jgi:transcriptional enhancer factor